MTFWPVLTMFKKDLNFTKSKELMAKGTFNLRKWNSNSNELLQLINNKDESVAQTKTVKPNAVVEEEDESFIKSTVGPTWTADTLVKTLGVCWNTAADWVCKHNASHQEITASVGRQSVWSFGTFESVHYHNEISVSVSLCGEGRLGCWIARKSSANVEGLCVWLDTIEWCENCTSQGQTDDQ